MRAGMRTSYLPRYRPSRLSLLRFRLAECTVFSTQLFRFVTCTGSVLCALVVHLSLQGLLQNSNKHFCLFFPPLSSSLPLRQFPPPTALHQRSASCAPTHSVDSVRGARTVSFAYRRSVRDSCQNTRATVKFGVREKHVRFSLSLFLSSCRRLFGETGVNEVR